MTTEFVTAVFFFPRKVARRVLNLNGHVCSDSDLVVVCIGFSCFVLITFTKITSSFQCLVLAFRFSEYTRLGHFTNGLSLPF